MRTTLSPVALFVGLAALAGCTANAPPDDQAARHPSAVAEVATAPAPAPDASVQAERSLAGALGHATYRIDVTANGEAPLQDGVYEESVPNSASKIVVRLAPDPAFGDLDGDGQQDAAVVLLADTGGSGSFTYVAAVMNRGGIATPLPAVALGDRITIDALRIVDGAILVSWLERDPSQPMTAPPTVKVEKRFLVRADKLTNDEPGG